MAIIQHQRRHTSAINCDGLHTMDQTALTTRIGTVHDDTMNFEVHTILLFT